MILKGWLQTEMIVKVLAPGRIRRNDLEGLAPNRNYLEGLGLEMNMEDLLPVLGH
jgi:hypothetical protein